MRLKRLFLYISSLSILLALVSCASVRYYAQSIHGQLEVLNKRTSIAKIVEDPKTPEALRAKFSLVQKARQFASDTLKLPDNDSYRTYSNLNRPYVVWNVFAAQEFSLEPETWCFPFVGCVAYRGYFAEQDAEAFAAQLHQQGYDVYVSGIAAYSTLGWFDDPILNTMLEWPDMHLVGLIFHELAHQVLYIGGDSTFNESFAMAVELEGIRRWAKRYFTEQDYQEYQRYKHRQQIFIELVLETKDRLEVIYASDLDVVKMRKAKQQALFTLLQRYQAQRKAWGDYPGYDRWMGEDINNAKIASIATYHEYVPAFQQLLQEQRGDMAAFFQAAKAIASLAEESRAQAMQDLIERANGSSTTQVSQR